VICARDQHVLTASRHAAVFAGALLLLLGSCASKDPVNQLIADLDDTARRERAIDGLLLLVRQAPAKKRQRVVEQVVHALCEAYRRDDRRGEIVAALALLKDRRAEQVFVAALKDAERGGDYFEAAVRSARLIGELGLKQHVPTLVAALRRWHAAPRKDRNTWLERSLIQALDRLRDRRAAPALIDILTADPVKHDFYLSRLAAGALGRLGDKRAVAPLVESLGAESHGLLLYEENRRALCRLGPGAAVALVKAAQARSRQGHPRANAAAAVRVLGDLGDQHPSTDGLTGLLGAADPDDLRLALGETLLRRGSREGAKLLQDLLARKSSSVTIRRRAAESLGWRGAVEDLPPALLSAHCSSSARGKQSAARDVLCWSVALAFTRLAGQEGLDRLDKLIAAREDEATSHNLKTYRVRLALKSACGADAACLVKALTGADWRRQERAALELGRGGHAAHAVALVRRAADAHPQVQQAILVALEQLEVGGKLDSKARARAGALLDDLVTNDRGDSPPPPAITSMALCLGQRLKRRRKEER